MKYNSIMRNRSTRVVSAVIVTLLTASSYADDKNREPTPIGDVLNRLGQEELNLRCRFELLREVDGAIWRTGDFAADSIHWCCHFHQSPSPGGPSKEVYVRSSTTGSIQAVRVGIDCAKWASVQSPEASWEGTYSPLAFGYRVLGEPLATVWANRIDAEVVVAQGVRTLTFNAPIGGIQRRVECTVSDGEHPYINTLTVSDEKIVETTVVDAFDNVALPHVRTAHRDTEWKKTGKRGRTYYRVAGDAQSTLLWKNPIDDFTGSVFDQSTGGSSDTGFEKKDKLTGKQLLSIYRSAVGSDGILDDRDPSLNLTTTYDLCCGVVAAWIYCGIQGERLPLLKVAASLNADIDGLASAAAIQAYLAKRGIETTCRRLGWSEFLRIRDAGIVITPMTRGANHTSAFAVQSGTPRVCDAAHGLIEISESTVQRAPSGWECTVIAGPHAFDVSGNRLIILTVALGLAVFIGWFITRGRAAGAITVAAVLVLATSCSRSPQLACSLVSDDGSEKEFEITVQSSHGYTISGLRRSCACVNVDDFYKWLTKSGGSGGSFRVRLPSRAGVQGVWIDWKHASDQVASAIRFDTPSPATSRVHIVHTPRERNGRSTWDVRVMIDAAASANPRIATELVGAPIGCEAIVCRTRPPGPGQLMWEVDVLVKGGFVSTDVAGQGALHITVDTDAERTEDCIHEVQSITL